MEEWRKVSFEAQKGRRGKRLTKINVYLGEGSEDVQKKKKQTTKRT